MRGCLIAVGLAGSLACRPAPVITPQDAGRPAPALELAAQTIDAGQAPLRFRQTARRQAVVSIRSHDALEPMVLEVIVNGPLSANPVLTLEPDSSTEVPVAIDLSRAGEQRGTITFKLADTAVSAAVFGVGTVAPDCLLAEPANIDFGTLNQGCPVAQRPVRIINDCVVPRLLSGGEVDPSVEPFALSELTTLPRRLMPGDSWAGLAEFSGGPPGRHEALLRFFIDGELGAAVGMLGVRSDAAPREFSITIPSPQIDVLVVLDSSPSFVPRRAAAELEVLFDLADFHHFPGPVRVGVVPTGGSQLIPAGGATYFESSQAAYQRRLSEALATSPSDGGALDSCIDAAAQVSAGVPFWRTGSRRMAVCITNAPEQSTSVAASMATLEDSGVRWNVIGPPLFDADGGCDVEAFDDGGHVFTTSALDGSVTNLCSPWRVPRLEPVSMSATQFVLPFTPSFPITVLVDGVQLSASEWVWDGSRRTLELLVAPQDTLVVRESLACVP